MRSVVFGAGLITLATAPAANPRSQTSPARPAIPPDVPVGTGLIVGRVLEADTRSPVQGAALWVRSYTGVSPVDIVRTNDHGDFVIRSLPKGRWFISVSKAGYVQTALNTGQEVVLDDGERLADLTLLVTRNAAIAGTIADERGDPLVGVQVALLDRSPRGRWRDAGFASTDDRGVYRFSSLRPGDYVVAVTSTLATVPAAQLDRLDALTAAGDRAAADWKTGVPRGLQRGAATTMDDADMVATIDRTPKPPRSAADGRRLAYATTFHPGVPAIGLARLITLSSGSERSGVDLRLVPVPTSRVTGSITSPNGQIARLTVSLVAPETRELPTFLTASTVTSVDGSFTFPWVPAGNYLLQVLKLAPSSGQTSSSPSAETLWASMPVAVGDADLTDLTVPLRAGLRVSGTVRFDGPAPGPPADRLMRASVLMAADDRGLTATTGVVVAGHPGADGRFTTIGLPAGRYLFNLPPPDPWRVKSAVWQGRDIADTLIELSDRDVTDISVTFTDRLPELAGIVRDDRGAAVVGATVVAFSTDRRVWTDGGVNPRRIKSARTLPNGRYTLVDLPAGDYFVMAFRRDPPSGWMNPDMLARLSGDATRTLVGDGGGTQDLRVAPDAPAAICAIDSGAIAGTLLIDDASPRPLPGATLTLNGADGAVARTTFTDDAGRFSFDGLPPGSYRLSASKPAFLATEYGARRPGRPGVAIVLTDGQRVVVTMKTAHGAAITGRVTDERGEPLAVTVQVLRRNAVTGDLILVPGAQPAQARTDERGIYRVYGLPSGEYYIGVTHGMIGAGTAGHETTPAEVQQAHAEVAGTSLSRTAGAAVREAPARQALTVYSPTFHPSASALADAVPVVVAQGEERTGVDLVVRLVPSVSIAGSVVAPDGSVPNSVFVTLSPDRPYIPASQMASSAGSGTAWSLGGLVTPPLTATGRFTILSLTPGTYNLIAQGTATLPAGDTGPGGGTTRMWARTTVTLAEHDLTDLVVSLQPGLTLRGHLVSDRAVPPPQIARLRVSLTAAQNGGPSVSPTPAAVDAAGRFVVAGLMPGAYRLSVAGLSDGWAAKSALMGLTDLLDSPMVLAPSDTSLDVALTLTDRPATLFGSAVDGSGRPATDYFVLAIAVDRRYWTSPSRRVQSVRPNAGGRFAFAALPAGDYWLCALTDLEPSDLTDVAFLEPLTRGAVRVALADGEQKTQDLKVASPDGGLVVRSGVLARQRSR